MENVLTIMVSKILAVMVIYLQGYSINVGRCDWKKVHSLVRSRKDSAKDHITTSHDIRDIFLKQ